MAIQFPRTTGHEYDGNQYAPTTGAAAIAALVGFLCSSRVGWTCKGFGTGGMSTNDGTKVTDGSLPTADNLKKPRSWVLIQQPNPDPPPNNTPDAYLGTRQIVFQRYGYDNNPVVNYNWNISYSKKGLFDLNLANCRTIPSATDRVDILGSYSGGDVNQPSAAQLFQVDGTYRIYYLANPEPPFQWFFTSFPGSNGGVSNFVVFDGLSSFVPGDADPYVIGAIFRSDGQAMYEGYMYADGGESGLKAWYKLNENDTLIGKGFVNVGLMSYNTNYGLVFPHNADLDPQTGNDDFVASVYGRHLGRGRPCGWKGVSSVFYWASISRNLGDLENVGGGTRNYIRMGGCAVPWDQSNPLL